MSVPFLFIYPFHSTYKSKVSLAVALKGFFFFFFWFSINSSKCMCWSYWSYHVCFHALLITFIKIFPFPCSIQFIIIIIIVLKGDLTMTMGLARSMEAKTLVKLINGTFWALNELFASLRNILLQIEGRTLDVRCMKCQ